MQYLKDVVERTVATYVATFLGLLLANGVDLTDIGAYKAAAVASLPAAITVVKAAIGRFLGDPGNAGWLTTGSQGRQE